MVEAPLHPSFSVTNRFERATTEPGLHEFGRAQSHSCNPTARKCSGKSMLCSKIADRYDGGCGPGLTTGGAPSGAAKLASLLRDSL